MKNMKRMKHRLASLKPLGCLLLVAMFVAIYSLASADAMEDERISLHHRAGNDKLQGRTGRHDSRIYLLRC